MMERIEIFEDAIIHANICLKKWEALGRTNWDLTRSIILTWLNKAYVKYYTGHNDWRQRKAISRRLHDHVFFTISSGPNIHITSITVNNQGSYSLLPFPELDYTMLNQKALEYVGINLDLSTLNFKTIESIKFV